MAGSVTPRSVVLNLVRVAPRRALPIGQLLKVGELFGFKSNALRVAVTRLTAEGLLESDERGSYRLGPSAASIHAHVEDWRKGEARMRPWKGEWLVVALGAKVERSTRRTSLAALARLGLCEGLPWLWLRPDNLAQPFAETVERLRGLGLEEAAQPFRARDFDAQLDQKARQLWPTRTLQTGYERTLRNLERSLGQLETMPRPTALVQSFLLGGEAIRVLATDPLLPEAIMPADTRRELTAMMLRYDAAGHRLWRSVATRAELKVLPGGRNAG
jgi:phenylacetic acid degradation operon negative regulatory protein